MRDFLKNVTLFSILIIAIIVTILGCKYYITNKISFQEASNVHYLFTGASHPWHAIDEKLMKTAINRSAGSERYLFTYLKLKKIIQENPQIDTIFIQCSSTDIWENSDDKYFSENEMSKFMPLYAPLFGKQEWCIFSNHLAKVAPLIIQKSFRPYQMNPNYIKNQMGSQASKNENMDILETSTVKQDMMKGNAGNKINYSYLRKIMNLCNEKGIKLYGIYYPLYKPEFFYNQKYYYEALKEHFPDLEVLDYSGWETPDSTRFDAHHLNWYGAQLFTKEIMNRFNIQ